LMLCAEQQHWVSRIVHPDGGSSNIWIRAHWM
jgi:hypothetical protein